MLGKPTAALSSSLLARKGHARPAMRPQGFVSLTPHAPDDLGWNDMGEDAAAQPDPVSPVLRMRAEIEQQIAPEATAPAPEIAPEPEPEPLAEATPEPEPAPAPIVSDATLHRASRAVHANGSKAAFTLRLDPERHLRLRLASAVRNLSAQQLVTEALDALLDSLSEVDALVRELEARERNG